MSFIDIDKNILTYIIYVSMYYDKRRDWIKKPVKFPKYVCKAVKTKPPSSYRAKTYAATEEEINNNY